MDNSSQESEFMKAVDVLDLDKNNNTDILKKIIDPCNNEAFEEESITKVDVDTPCDKISDILTTYKRTGGSDNIHSPRHLFQTKSSRVFDHVPFLNQDRPRMFNLVKFVTASVTTQLKTLGLDDLDSKELVETWLSHRRQKRWKQALPTEESHNDAFKSTLNMPPLQEYMSMANTGPGISNILTPVKIKTVNTSKPNSSMLRLSGSGNKELESFLTNIEEVRTHLNNASCTLLQVTTVMMLPYLKLLTGNQLETTDYKVFLEDWVQIIGGMVAELNPTSVKESKIMLNREFQSLLAESKRLTKTMTKIAKKVKYLYEDNEFGYKKYMGRLNPRSLTCRTRLLDREDERNETTTNILMNKAFLTEPVQFTPLPLYRFNINSTDLFKNHIFFTKSTNESLLFKEEMSGTWGSFTDLTFQKRRDLLLSVVEDLRWTLASASNTTITLKELFIQGYPESIRSKITDNLKYLKKASKKDELLVLTKCIVCNQVKLFLESLARLVKISKDTLEISKYFQQCITLTNQKYAPSTSALFRNQIIKWSQRSQKKQESPSRSDFAKIKLLVPFPISTDPKEDQFYLTS